MDRIANQTMRSEIELLYQLNRTTGAEGAGKTLSSELVFESVKSQ